MKKSLSQLLSLVLSLCLLLTLLPALPPSAAAAQPKRTNIALNKPVEASGHEVDDGRFLKEFAVDGDASTNAKRWSSNKTLPDEPVWIYVDLGKVTSFEEIVLTWEAANSRDYDIQISNDAENWTVLRSFQFGDELAFAKYTEDVKLDRPSELRLAPQHLNL